LNARGKTNFKTGFKILARNEIRPQSLNTSITPFQKTIIPSKERVVVTLFCAPTKIPSFIPSKFPEKIPKAIEIIHNIPKHIPIIKAPKKIKNVKNCKFWLTVSNFCDKIKSTENIREVLL
jgi:hypothetical protein